MTAVLEQLQFFNSYFYAFSQHTFKLTLFTLITHISGLADVDKRSLFIIECHCKYNWIFIDMSI